MGDDLAWDTGGRRDQNAEVEHGSTSATGDWVAGPVSIEMWRPNLTFT